MGGFLVSKEFSMCLSGSSLGCILRLFGWSYLLLLIVLLIIRLVIHVLKWWFYSSKSTIIRSLS